VSYAPLLDGYFPLLMIHVDINQPIHWQAVDWVFGGDAETRQTLISTLFISLRKQNFTRLSRYSCSGFMQKSWGLAPHSVYLNVV
jgi:hypothetical protein